MKMKKNSALFLRFWMFSLLFVAACVTSQTAQKGELQKTEPVAVYKSLEEICKEKGLPYPPKNVRVALNKADSTLNIMINKMVLKSYKVAVGENLDANRLFDGDNATPEGLYKVLLRQKSGKERSLMLNYPSMRDMQNYKKAVAGNTLPKNASGKNLRIASSIKIFAGDISKPTKGSIVVSPGQFKEVYRVLRKGTPITIERGETLLAKKEAVIVTPKILPPKKTEKKAEPVKQKEPKPFKAKKKKDPVPEKILLAKPTPPKKQIEKMTGKSLEEICKEKGLPYPPKNVRVVLNKAENRLDVLMNKMLLKSYKVAVGENLDATRLFDGDKATPEGLYKVLMRQKSRKNRSLVLNYPTMGDLKMYRDAVSKKRIPKNASGKFQKIAGGIKIFAGDISKTTNGNIAVDPNEFKEVFKVLRKGTPITIERGETALAKLKKAKRKQEAETGLASLPQIESAPTSSKVAMLTPVSAPATKDKQIERVNKEEKNAKKEKSEPVNMDMLMPHRKDFVRELSAEKQVEAERENTLPENTLATRIFESTGLSKNDNLSFSRPMFKLTDKSVRDVGPKFSPDGKYVSFSRIDRVYNDVWVWEQETNKLRRVTLERGDMKDASFVEGARFSYGGIWGSDAEKMLIISSFKGNYDIYLFDIAEDKFVPITKDRAWDGNPSWSPDGGSMAFVSARSGNGDIWTKKIGRYFFSKPKQLTDNPGIDFAPVWSHDSKKVFYTSRQFENYDIYVIDTEDGIPVRLTFTESADRYVSLSPSGKKIAFFSDFNISIMDLEEMDLASLEVQTDPNGWSFKELPYNEAEKRTTLLIPDIEIQVHENRAGREVTYKKNVQYIKALTALEGPIWTAGGDRIVFVANKPLKPIYVIGLNNLHAEDYSNIYEIETESEIHRDLNLSSDGKALVFGTFRNDYSRFNNNLTLVEFTNPPKQVREKTLIAKILPEFLVKQARSWYQITNPPPQDVSFLNKGRTGLVSGTGVIGVSGGR